ncbi:hypothetical protein FRC14_001768 [Serendipita sp. 396]|nr:hypothetical protein FRC14_001768 [Serendipita sp. 396]KAG8777081.1 hypothetical protein FRC15_011551 [Serendipita sp. 397]KAG8791075.1 hypothetical protein FRC16_000609 [Serendipita sp. 398]
MQPLHDFNDRYAEEMQFIVFDTALYDDYEEFEVALILSEQDDVLGTLPVDQDDDLSRLPKDELTMSAMETDTLMTYLVGQDNYSNSTWAAGVASPIHVHLFTVEEDFLFDPLEHHVQNIYHAFEPDEPVQLPVPLDDHVGVLAGTMNWEPNPFEDEASAWRNRLSSAYEWSS